MPFVVLWCGVTMRQSSTRNVHSNVYSSAEEFLIFFSFIFVLFLTSFVRARRNSSLHCSFCNSFSLSLSLSLSLSSTVDSVAQLSFAHIVYTFASYTCMWVCIHNLWFVERGRKKRINNSHNAKIKNKNKCVCIRLGFFRHVYSFFARVYLCIIFFFLFSFVL